VKFDAWPGAFHSAIRYRRIMNQTSRPLPASYQVAQASTLFSAGRLMEAEAITRQVLMHQPAHADALNLLGSIALRNGQPDAAAAILQQAASAAPRATGPRINLGHALKAAGRLGEAIEAYRCAVRLKPRDAQAQYALGTGLLADGQYEAAEAALREATRAAPQFADAYNNLGHVLRQLGQPAEAEAAFRQALGVDPGQAEWHLNLALAVGEQHRTADAITALRDALSLAPDHVDALHAYGTLLVRTGRFEDAIGPLRRLRARQPGSPDPFAGLAQALTALGEVEEALALAQETVRLVPDSAGARSNLGAALLAVGRLADAADQYEVALELEPQHALGRTGRAFVRLRQGRLEEAWDDYEARLDAQRLGSDQELTLLVDPNRLSGEAWDGGPRHGRSLLVYPEQGQGDAIQMARYGALLGSDGPVLWVVPPSLRRLMIGVVGITRVLTPQDEIPPHDLHCSVMSLPRLFRTSLRTIPGGVPYVHADPVQTEVWRARLAGCTGRKIGLAWQGNPDYLLDRLRSVPPQQLALLSGARDVVFVSLQLPQPATPPPLPLIDLTEELTDFGDTAALIMALDLVITVDTSVAHLAGALGRPVWLLNRFNTDWRWLMDRNDSPWYPTMRIFRQPAPRDWDSVLTEVRAALDGDAAFARRDA
jgi:tetratricopeptide (TPR) repeat protein